ncbi:MAG TPA: hypothetical protein VNS22_10985 [Geminicoccus sp.]|uniref:hypothetical protein n=1 Tax=Geminicoccus sp. TaxID=2024832 RepID=UPI002D0FD7D1|nr:hypothetical protein [Geminicoccus sp.]HWL68896.1 hypothetical protein [Geminicoccus sp.]
MVSAVPLLILVVGAYNFMALTGAGVEWDLFRLYLPSGALLALQFGDLLVMIGIVLLYLEIWKSLRIDRPFFDRALSMGLLAIVLLEFLLFDRFGTGTYALILILCLMDVIAGFTVSASRHRIPNLR